ncbi:MAG: non-heme iron oxygenase ferredoxin subunit [Tabrizicola sp.]|nr:non-heme iron oxygenase ferredoxin subunit [Tabrizicola sp.]
MSWTKLCCISDIPEDDGLRLDRDDRGPLAVWRVGDAVYVTDDTCTHGQASLTEGGILDGFQIECGLHLGAFDIRDGKVTSAPCTVPLRVYPVRLDAGEVFAHLNET